MENSRLRFRCQVQIRVQRQNKCRDSSLHATLSFDEKLLLVQNGLICDGNNTVRDADWQDPVGMQDRRGTPSKDA